MKSMTGYGRGEASQHGYKITVEISSVNRKQSEITVYLPRELESLEARVRDEINRQIARGRVIVKVGIHAGDGLAAGAVELNVPLAKAYAGALGKLARDLGIPAQVTLDHLIRAPGVLRGEAEFADAARVWPVIEKALTQATKALVQMRVKEGEHLQADLNGRLKTMDRAADRIQKRAPLMVKHYREQLQLRIKGAGLAFPAADDERLLKEIVYFAERSDISEELTRLKSHFKQLATGLSSKEPVGRTLDFLAQEINREVNTVGSKASDSVIAAEVVKLKAELEKFREQVQNVE